MDLLQTIFSISILFTASNSAIIKQRRDAFNPNQLMEDYMGMRNGQTSFGSFHPNDLVKTIQNYFQHGGTQLLPNNQWGLSVYNPNEAIEQYVGRMKSPGGLGPEEKESNIVKENRVAQMTDFNPDQLNQMLLSGMDSETYSISPESMTSDQFGFDADDVNRQLMQDINNSQQEFGTSTPAGDEASGSITTQTPTQQNQGFGFNANALNANLFSSLEYDPNSAMPGMPDFQDNTATTTTTTASQGSGSSSYSFNTSTSALSGGTSLTGSTQAGTSMGGSSSQNGGFITGSNQPGVNSVGTAGLIGGTFAGSNPSGVNSAGTVGQTGGIFAGSNAGTVPPALSTGSTNGGNFNPGGLGGSSSGNQGGSTGQQGGTLSQTGVAVPAPSGIGGIGGR